MLYHLKLNQIQKNVIQVISFICSKKIKYHKFIISDTKKKQINKRNQNSEYNNMNQIKLLLPGFFLTK